MAGFTHPDAVTVQLDRAAAIDYAVQTASVGDIVLVAGKGHEATQLIGEAIFPFDDGKVVEASLAKYRKVKQ